MCFPSQSWSLPMIFRGETQGVTLGSFLELTYDKIRYIQASSEQSVGVHSLTMIMCLMILQIVCFDYHQNYFLPNFIIFVFRRK